MEAFLNALHEVIPAFGASTDELERCSGKTAMAATVGIGSDFSYVKIVGNRNKSRGTLMFIVLVS
ncbi:putative vesicle-fusing ATPase [Helianthus annuus]|nr:putative vesicle-fusing ATPase [Helianthus annuus]